MEDNNQDKHECLIAKAKLAEQAERYDDMISHMKEAAELDIALNADERNLLSVAFKNVVGTRRSSWRVLSSLEQKEEDSRKKNLALDCLVTIGSEIRTICDDVVTLIDNHLLKKAKAEDHDSITFYMKMKGDYFRYVAEVASKDDKPGYATKAEEAYSQAYTICKEKMKPPHPIRLGLALNFSVFYYEILEKHNEACNLAREAFDDAIKEMDGLDSNSFKDSSLIMQLLRDNLTLWTAAEDDEQEDQQQIAQDEEGQEKADD